MPVDRIDGNHRTGMQDQYKAVTGIPGWLIGNHREALAQAYQVGCLATTAFQVQASPQAQASREAQAYQFDFKTTKLSYLFKVGASSHGSSSYGKSAWHK
jgi:hypothetical protein